jgi:hypothetical protein
VARKELSRQFINEAASEGGIALLSAPPRREAHAVSANRGC